MNAMKRNEITICFDLAYDVQRTELLQELDVKHSATAGSHSCSGSSGDSGSGNTDCATRCIPAYPPYWSSGFARSTRALVAVMLAVLVACVVRLFIWVGWSVFRAVFSIFDVVSKRSKKHKLQ